MEKDKGNLRAYYFKAKKDELFMIFCGFALMAGHIGFPIWVTNNYAAGKIEDSTPLALLCWVVFLGLPITIGVTVRKIKKYSRAMWEFSYICPECKRSIERDDVKFKCPFCNKHHNSLVDLFESCSKTDRIIQKFRCPKCHKVVDLFAPYDYEELKESVYE